MELSVRAGSMQGFERLMHELGHDPRPLLRRCGLSPAILADEDRRVPMQSAFDLLAVSAEATGREDLGLLAAEVQDIDMLGPLALMMQNAPTVAASLDLYRQYQYVQSPACTIEVVARSEGVAGAADIRYEPTAGGRIRVVPQVFDHGLALIHQVVRLLSEGRYRLLAVSLPFVPRSVDAHARFYNVPIRTGQPCAALHVSQQTLAAPVRAARAGLLKIATDYVERHYPQPAAEVAPRVHLALTHSLANRFMDKATIAQMLAMHPRTLQRRLEREGTSFDQIRDAVRREATLRYLQSTPFPIARVAALVGYTEQSTFTRFCRDKIGKTPARIRADGARRASRSARAG
jgi:AraC-like DNA-binding protein